MRFSFARWLILAAATVVVLSGLLILRPFSAESNRNPVVANAGMQASEHDRPDMVGPENARAEEAPTFRIEFRGGVASPARLEAPAKTRIRLELVNLDDTPAEFESRELRKEKVLAPKSTSILVIRSLEPGEYSFFDDFHPGGPAAALVVK